MKKNSCWVFILLCLLFLIANYFLGWETGGTAAIERKIGNTAEIEREDKVIGTASVAGIASSAISTSKPLMTQSESIAAPNSASQALPFSAELFAAFWQDMRVCAELKEQAQWYSYIDALADWEKHGSDVNNKPQEPVYPNFVFMAYQNDEILLEMAFSNRAEQLLGLQALEQTNGLIRAYFVSNLVPYIVASVHRQNLYRVATLPIVQRFIPNYRAMVANDPPHDSSYNLHSVGHYANLGYRGSGILVGILDTGFYKAHQYYKHDMIEQGRDFGTENNPWLDVQGHGTNVAGIFSMSGSGADNDGWLGMTLDATLRIAKVAQGDEVLSSAIQAEAVEWLLDPNQDQNYEDSVDIITSSVGMLGLEPNTLSALVDNITMNNLAVFVVAAGNCGDVPVDNCDDYVGLISPANVRGAISVGNVQQDKYLNTSSSYGNLSDASGNYTKPDVVCYGTNLISLGTGTDDELVSVTGTSFAAPAVAAIVALILQKTREMGLDYTHLELKELLAKNTEKPHAVYDTDTLRYGRGLVSLANVFDYLESPQCQLNFAVSPMELSAVAKWKTTAMSEWQGMSNVKLPPGNHTIVYQEIAGYTTPANMQLKIKNQTTEALSPVWTALPQGTLRFTVSPEGLVGSAWREIDTNDWLSFSDTYTFIEGVHCLEFKEVPDYTTPSYRCVTIERQQLSNLEVTYLPLAQPELTVVIEPENIALQGGWRFLGELPTFDSGSMVVLSPGNYQLEFLPVADYITPEPLSITLTLEQQLTVTQSYQLGTAFYDGAYSDFPDTAGQRCSPEAFAHVPAQQPLRLDYRSQIDNLQLSANEGGVLSFQGVLVNPEQMPYLGQFLFFPVVYRCDENSTAGTVWERIDIADEFHRSIQSGEVSYTAVTEQPSELRLYDQDLIYTHEYWYLVLVLAAVNNNNLEQAYQAAVDNFSRHDAAAVYRPQNWSNFLLARFQSTFDFSPQNRVDENIARQSNLLAPDTFLPLWFDGSDVTHSNFIFYDFHVFGQSVSGQSLSTAEFRFNSFHLWRQGIEYNLLTEPGFNADDGAGISAAGFKLTSATDGLFVRLMATDSAMWQTNDILQLDIEAFSSLVRPSTTSISLSFIVQEAKKPFLQNSYLCDADDLLPYDWPVDVVSINGVTLWPAQVAARYLAVFSEEVQSAKWRFDIVEGQQGGETTALWALNSHNAAGTDSHFYADISTDVWRDLLDDSDYIEIKPFVSQATDVNNMVLTNRNTMLPDSTFSLYIVTTPYVLSCEAGSQDLPLARNGTVAVHFSEPIATSNDDIKKALQVTGLANFHLQKINNGRSLWLVPWADEDLVNPNVSIAELHLPRGSVLNYDGYPSITDWNCTIYFTPDQNPPFLKFYNWQGNPSMTELSGHLLFNENLLNNAAFPRLFLSALGEAEQELVKNQDFTVTFNRIYFAISDLLAPREYSIRALVADGDGNDTICTLPSFITVEPTDELLSDIELAEQLSADLPRLVELSPDLRSSANWKNQPLRPCFRLEFSRPMANSVTESLLLARAGEALPWQLDFFQDSIMQLIPCTDLLPDTEYTLSFIADKAIDLTGQVLVSPPSFKFRTIKEQVDSTAPTEYLHYLGNNISATVERNFQPRFYFDRQLNLRSLYDGIEFTNAAHEKIDGIWQAEGQDVLFGGFVFMPANSYTCTIYTSRIRDLVDLEISSTNVLTNTFTVRAESDIRNFRVSAEGRAETLCLTAAWLPAVQKGGIDTYRLGYHQLMTLTEPSIGVQPTWLATIAHSDSQPSFSHTTQIDNFVQGNSYRLMLQAERENMPVTSSFVDLLSIAATKSISRVPVFIGEEVQVGSWSETGAVLNIKPRQVLQESESISFARVENEEIKQMPGGGERYAPLLQLGPAGLQFQEPVVLGLLFSPLPTQSFLDISPLCTQLNEDCSQSLLSLLHPLVLDFPRQQWTNAGLGKKKVEFLDDSQAIMYVQVPHFSIYTVAAALSIVNPPHKSNLATIRSDANSYSAVIYFNRAVTVSDVTVSFFPADSNLSYSFIENGSALEIYLPDTSFLEPENRSEKITVQVILDDVGSGLRDSRTYYVPIDYVGGNPSYSGYPHNVDKLAVWQSSATKLEVEWSIENDTNRQIHQFLLSYRRLWPEPSSIVEKKLPRTQLSYSLPVKSGERWELTMATESYSGLRSNKADDIVRYNSGRPENIVNASAAVTSDTDWETAGRRVNVLRFTINSGERAYYFKYSAADIHSLQGAGLPFSAANKLSNGAEFFPETLFDFNFSATSTAEVSYLVNRQGGNYCVYHFNGSAWQRLTGSTELRAEIRASGDNTAVKIKSFNGVGSPFVLGVALEEVPVYQSEKPTGGAGAGGAGGCVVAGGDYVDITANSNTTWLSFLLNLFVMLFPLAWLLYLKYVKH